MSKIAARRRPLRVAWSTEPGRTPGGTGVAFVALVVMASGIASFDSSLN
jgi:hypothetical protein